MVLVLLPVFVIAFWNISVDILVLKALYLKQVIILFI